MTHSHARGAQGILTLRKPYLLFIGDAENEAQAKTAFGLRDWVPESCLAQLRLPGSQLNLRLPDMNPRMAANAGARSLVIGIAPVGGLIPPSWRPALLEAADAGLDIVSGMHAPLEEIPGLAEAAKHGGARLINVRLPRQQFAPASGRRRSGKRLLTVGTDCALGKKYTALAIAKTLRARGIDTDFRATGQTGIMIAGGGIAIDAVIADFCAGAAEALSPDAAPDHWDVIEGQGSLFHPAYAGVTLSLIHGSQPDVLVLCHDSTRAHLNAFPDYPLPDLRAAADTCLKAARLTNPDVRLAAISLNTSTLDLRTREAVIAETAACMNVPCFDPLQSDMRPIADRILAP
jgi:uncharacterized NAD-dependent epimerase/dehydratase family protein